MPSSVIHDFHYSPAARRLEVRFVSGRRYRYDDVPEAVYRAMRAARSKGEYFNDHVRDRFAFSRED